MIDIVEGLRNRQRVFGDTRAGETADFIEALEAQVTFWTEQADLHTARIEALELRNSNLEEQRDAHAKRAMALENALREILDYGGAAESALHDEYVVDRAQTALAPEQDK